MHVGPFHTDYYAVVGMREITIVASNYDIVFFLTFCKKLDLYEEDLKQT